MPNIVDAKIAEITDQHTSECEKLNVSRNVQETKRRIEVALVDFSKVDVLASGYWEGLGDAAKLVAVRSAVVEIAEKLAKTAPKAEPAPVSLDQAVEVAASEPVAAKKARKAKAAA